MEQGLTMPTSTRFLGEAGRDSRACDIVLDFSEAENLGACSWCFPISRRDEETCRQVPCFMIDAPRCLGGCSSTISVMVSFFFCDAPQDQRSRGSSGNPRSRFLTPLEAVQMSPSSSRDREIGVSTKPRRKKPDAVVTFVGNRVPRRSVQRHRW